MKHIQILTFLIILTISSSLASAFNLFNFFNITQTSQTSSFGLKNQLQIFTQQNKNIDTHVLKLGLTAYYNAQKKGLDNKGLLTIIDYSQPSFKKRMWVFDLKRNKTLYNTWVTHGKNSGLVNATSFSNQLGSLKSSIGVFLTGKTYIGKNGYSLKLNGLEYGINDNAAKRAIVIHGAWYAGPDIINKQGQLGRSWGCPAIETKLSKPLINTIKDKTLVFAYYPDKNWINNSKFLMA